MYTWIEFFFKSNCTHNLIFCFLYVQGREAVGDASQRGKQIQGPEEKVNKVPW